MQIAEIISALQRLSGNELEKLWAAVSEERERRRAVSGKKSLTEELDVLSALLAEQMDCLAAAESDDFKTATWELVQRMLTIISRGHYPVFAVAGYRKSWPCRYCREKDVAACWPEVLGVKPWDWPWQPLEPVTHDSKETYIRGFVFSFATVEKAGATVAVHVAPRFIPHKHSREYPASKSAYFAVTRGADGTLALENITWARYRRLCSQAAQAVPELAAAQEKSVQETQKFIARQH